MSKKREPNQERIDAFYSKQMAERMKEQEPERSVYVCTVCKRATQPTLMNNLRCSNCDAPLLKSLEKITELRRQFKYAKENREKQREIAETIALIRQMREDHPICEQAYIEEKNLARKDDTPERKPYVPHKEVGLYDVYLKGGQVLNVRCETTEDISLLQQKAAKLRATIKFAGTERWHETMDDIRRSNIEVQRTDTE